MKQFNSKKHIIKNGKFMLLFKEVFKKNLDNKIYKKF